MSADSGHGFVQITNREIYDKLENIDRTMQSMPASLIDHEIRLRALEMKMWGMFGLASGVGTIAGALLSRVLGA